MRLNWDGIFAVLSLFLMVVFVGCGGDKSGKSKDAGSADQAEKKVPLQKSSKVTKDSPKKITWEKDGVEMVLIPESFTRTKDTYDKVGDLVPGEVVKVTDYFYMDTTEVTVGQFKTFLKSSGYEPKLPINWNKVYERSPTGKHPMIYVSWHHATAYAKWAGKRLPTEAEWEFAARGGLVNKTFPWGDDESIAREYANFYGTGGKDQWDNSTAPVGSFRPNGYGLYDMAGNVWEWCQDWYDSDHDSRVLRGGSWYNHLITTYLRVASRYGSNPSNTYFRNGFRCVSGL